MNYIRTTPVEEFRDSLEFAARTIADMPETPSAWRWVILSLQLALQGALVRALTHPAVASDGSLILEDHVIPRYRAWLEGGALGDPPNRKLAIPQVLLRRACDPALMGSWALTLTDRERDDVEALRLLRNEFAHFHLDGWSVQIEGLPRIVRSTAAVIERLQIEPAVDASTADAHRIHAALATLKTTRDVVSQIATA